MVYRRSNTSTGKSHMSQIQECVIGLEVNHNLTMCLIIKNVLKPCRGMQCFLFSEPATKNTICYQTVEKAISAGFKMQTLQAHFQALSGKGLCSFKTIFSCYFTLSSCYCNSYKTPAILPIEIFCLLIGRYMSISPWWSIFVNNCRLISYIC